MRQTPTRSPEMHPPTKDIISILPSRIIFIILVLLTGCAQLSPETTTIEDAGIRNPETLDNIDTALSHYGITTDNATIRIMDEGYRVEFNASAPGHNLGDNTQIIDETTHTAIISKGEDGHDRVIIDGVWDATTGRALDVPPDGTVNVEYGIVCAPEKLPAPLITQTGGYPKIFFYEEKARCGNGTATYHYDASTYPLKVTVRIHDTLVPSCAAPTCTAMGTGVLTLPKATVGEITLEHGSQRSTFPFGQFLCFDGCPPSYLCAGDDLSSFCVLNTTTNVTRAGMAYERAFSTTNAGAQ